MIEIMLQNIRKLRKEVRDLQEQIAVLEDKAMPGGLKTKDVQVQTSGKADPMADAIVLYVDEQAKLQQKIRTLSLEINIAEYCIAEIEDPEERRVMWLYYVAGDKPLSMNDVARKIPCAPSTAWSKRSEGLKHAELILNKLRTLSDSIV